MKPTLISAWLLQILNDLTALDKKLAPGGLYAANRDLVFSKVLFPALKAHGYRIEFSRGGEYAYFVEKSVGDAACVRLETVSKIKIRQFGSQHVLDRHVHHDARWDEKKMERLLSKLWSKSPNEKTSLVLLLGFDSASQALGPELRRLEEAVGCVGHGVTSYRRIWPDPHSRDFHTCACLWTRKEEAEL